MCLCWGRLRDVVAVGGGAACVARAMGTVEVMVSRTAARPVSGLVITGIAPPLQMMERRMMAAPRSAHLIPLVFDGEVDDGGAGSAPSTPA